MCLGNEGAPVSVRIEQALREEAFEEIGGRRGSGMTII